MVKNRYRLILFLMLCQLSLMGFAANFYFKSSSFTHHGSIPPRFTCDGQNIPPTLFWQNPPPKTKSFALIVEDADSVSGEFVHWLLFNIPANAWFLRWSEKLPPGTISGRNSFGTLGYRGPCPPNGSHHYFFKLFVLDKMLKLNSTATRDDLIAAMRGHILKTRELMGVYSAS